MIDLLEYLDANAQGTYYERLKAKIPKGTVVNRFTGKVSKVDYTIYDEVELEEKFREICQPASEYSSEDDAWFILISFYCFKQQIQIKQFPRLFERPKGLYEFAYNDIRQYAFENGYTNGDMGTVRWATRRQIIGDLIFERRAGVSPSEEIVSLVRLIESNNSAWQSMQVEAKLAALNNVIEHCLKHDGHFIDIPNIENINNFVLCKEFRTLTHCMRHGAEDALLQRELLSESEKQFLVDYGVSIVHLILRNLKTE